MAKEAMIHARIEAHLKEEVEGIFQELGLSITDAVTLFYQQVRLHKGLPFDVSLPNDITCQTFEDTDAGRNLVRCENTQDMFDKLGL